MNFETILIDKKDHIGIISLNRPDQLNTFNVTMAKELNQSLNEMDQDNEIRVVLIKGNGLVFSAGIDVRVLPMKSILDYRFLTW